MTERADLLDLEHLDTEALKALIRAQHAEILRQKQALHSKDEQLTLARCGDRAPEAADQQVAA